MPRWGRTSEDGPKPFPQFQDPHGKERPRSLKTKRCEQASIAWLRSFLMLGHPYLQHSLDRRSSLDAPMLGWEDHPMKRTTLSVASLFLAASFAAPAALLALPLPQEVKAQVRVYDKEHKDYHNWDDKEDHAWNEFLTENHRKSHEFA